MNKLILSILALTAVAYAQNPVKRDLGCTPATASGTTYTCSITSAPAAYVTGETYYFIADVANTGAVTINFNSLGAKSVTKVQGGVTTALAAGDIQIGQVVAMRYDGTRMQMQSQLGNAASGAATTASYLTATAEAGLSAETNLGALTTGMLKHTVSGGTSVPATATAGTDYTSPSSTETQTNKTYDAEGTGNVLTIPFPVTFKTAVCQGSTASLAGSTLTGAAAVAACVTGTNTNFGVAQFADGATTLGMQDHFTLPSDWTGAIDFKGKWRTSATTGSVVWQVGLACVANAETSDPSFNVTAITDAALGTTVQQNDFSTTGITATGCAAGEEAYFRVFRDPTHASDDLAATAELISFTFTIRRAI